MVQCKNGAVTKKLSGPITQR